MIIENHKLFFGMNNFQIILFDKIIFENCLAPQKPDYSYDTYLQTAASEMRR